MMRSCCPTPVRQITSAARRLAVRVPLGVVPGADRANASIPQNFYESAAAAVGAGCGLFVLAALRAGNIKDVFRRRRFALTRFLVFGLQTGGGGYIRIVHQLQDDCGSGAGGLLQPRNSLMYGLATRFSILLYKLGHLQPSQQRLRSDACSSGRLFYVLLREQGGDRLLLLSGEF